MTAKNLKVKVGENVFSFTKVDMDVNGDYVVLSMEKTTENFVTLLSLEMDFQVENYGGNDVYVVYDLMVSSVVYVAYK